MRYMADITYLIDLINNDPGAVKVAEEMDLLGERVGLSVISVEEYVRGVYYLYWDDKELLKKKIADAENDLRAFEIIPLTYNIVLKAAEMEVSLMKKGEIISLPDIFIASTAVTNNLILITRNIKHFKRIDDLKIRPY